MIVIPVETIALTVPLKATQTFFELNINQAFLIVSLTGAVVTEGKSVVIDNSKLDASNLKAKLSIPEQSSYEVWFQVKFLPDHGVIVVGERNLTKEKRSEEHTSELQSR